MNSSTVIVRSTDGRKLRFEPGTVDTSMKVFSPLNGSRCRGRTFLTTPRAHRRFYTCIMADITRPWTWPDAAASSAQAVKGYRAGRQMSQVKVVANYGDLCGEGPVWDADRGCLYWTDIDGHRFYRYHQATDTHELLKRGLEIAGYCINQPSGFTIANGDGIWLWDGGNDLRLIAD